MVAIDNSYVALKWNRKSDAEINTKCIVCKEKEH